MPAAQHVLARVTVLAVGALLVLTACSPAADHEAEPDDQEVVSAEQAAALEDNVVTEEEYTAGYRRFVACLADKGYTVLELGRPSTLYEAGIPDAAVQSGADEECYNGEWSGIDLIWQTNNPERTILSDWYIACLKEVGIETEDPGGSNNNELEKRMVEAGLTPGACIEAHDPR
jgi:hypothetical protein